MSEYRGSCKRASIKWRKEQKVVRKTDHSRKAVNLRKKREQGSREVISLW